MKHYLAAFAASLLMMSASMAWSANKGLSKLCAMPNAASPCASGDVHELKCRDGLIVRVTNPKVCLLGDQCPLEFEVKACDDVCDVVVNAQLPPGVTYIKSEPQAKQEGGILTWNCGPMKNGQSLYAKVWVKCETEGELCACFCAKATPVSFCTLVCAKPKLACQNCGPAKAGPGDTINYKVTVTNNGSCAAENVVLTYSITDILQHFSGHKSFYYSLGSLAPGESKNIDIPLCALKRGNACNRAVVSSSNADSVTSKICTNICCSELNVVKTGPKEQSLGKNADYQISVTNTGDVPLNHVVITDTAPPATAIISANGATVRGNQAIWKLKELQAGEKATFVISLTTCTPGNFTSRANVCSIDGCNASSEATTRWKGRPSLHACISDTNDPICVNDPTSYDIQLSNQGLEPDSNVKVIVRFPKEVQPLVTCGDLKGTISGQTVTYQACATMWPKQTLNLRIDAKGRESGEGRVIVEVTSDSIGTPIAQQESTTVY